MQSESYTYRNTQVILGDTEISVFRFRARHEERSTFSHATSTSLHRHTFYELQLVKTGVYPFKTANDTVEMQAGELVIVPPETLHFSYMMGQGFTMQVLSFSVRRLEEGYPLYEELKEALHRFAGQALSIPPSLREQIASWAEMIPQTAKEAVRDQIAAVNLFGDLIETLGVGKGDVKDPALDNGKGSADLILDTMVGDVRYNLADIAKALNYSDRQTARLIQKNYGETLARLRRRRRARTLRQLLVAEPEASVSSLAERAGYSGSALAYSDFKRFYGLTPNGFRQLLRAGKVPSLLPEEDEKIL